MKLKNLLLAFITLIVTTLTLFSHAHEGHAPAGVIHELHHMLWIVMALAVSGLAVYLIIKIRKKEESSPD